MAAMTDSGSSSSTGESRCSVGKLAADPYSGISYHYGMLLGVTDFEAQQAYHRGKMRLHNAWLHRAGVVWGLVVQTNPNDKEWKNWSLKVTRGLALDVLGRELHVDTDSCLKLDDWFLANQNDMGKDNLGKDNLEVSGTSATVKAAHVVISFSACPTREVPAIVEPCTGNESATACSRIFESAKLELRPGLWKGHTRPSYPRLELLFRLRQPVTQADVDRAGSSRSVFQSDDSEKERLKLAMERDKKVLEAMEKLRKVVHEEQPACFRALFHRFAVEDQLEIAPPKRPGESAQLSLFPASEEAAPTKGEPPEDVLSLEVPLANISNICLTLTKEGNTEKITGATFKGVGCVDNTIRPVHLATATLQELLNPFAPESAILPPGPGPRVVRDSAHFDCRELTFQVDRPLLSPTVTPAAFSITQYADSCGWRKVHIEHARYRLCEGRYLVTLELCESPWHHDIRCVRFIARGTGETPLLGIDLAPLAGLVGGPPADTNNGIDYVAMFRRPDHDRSQTL